MVWVSVAKVKDAEDGGVDADAERQGQDDHEREAGQSPHRAKAVQHVSEQVFQ